MHELLCFADTPLRKVWQYNPYLNFHKIPTHQMTNLRLLICKNNKNTLSETCTYRVSKLRHPVHDFWTYCLDLLMESLLADVKCS